MQADKDHQVQMFLLTIAVEVLLAVIVSKFNKKILSGLSIALFILAGFWPSLNSNLSPELSASIVAVANNGWAWFELIMVAVIFLALKGYGPFSSLMHLPVPIPDEDKRHLRKELTPYNKDNLPKVQIIYANRTNSREFAHELSDILIEVGWVQIQPPSASSPFTKVPNAVLTIRSSHIDPALRSSIKLSVALQAIGLIVSRKEDPKLRKFDHCMLYVNGY
jgi:hypothetical protein